jgi:hypothetical protein
MDKLLLQLAIATTLGGLLSPDPTIAQNYTPPGRILPPAKRAGHIEIVQGPALEFAHDDIAIIRWTTNSPGGSDDHFAVIHYGTDPMHEPDDEISHPPKPGPSADDFPCTRGRPEAADDLLLLRWATTASPMGSKALSNSSPHQVPAGGCSFRKGLLTNVDQQYTHRWCG